MRVKMTTTFFLLFLTFSGIEAQSVDRVTAFKFRSDFTIDLDEDEGWAAEINVAPRQTIDTPFRVRFEIEADGSKHRRQYSLQYKWNDGSWRYMSAEEFPYESQYSPVTSIVGCNAYFNGAEADDLIAVSNLPAALGAGISMAPTTPGWTPEEKGGESVEWEWALVIRHWSDGPLQVKNGDRFSFRMVDQSGKALSGPTPEVTVEVPEYHLGGTFVETPARIGPWENDRGELYFIMEPTETDNVFMMVKSVDNGKSWVEVDGENRPSIGDLEGVGSVMTPDGIIHIVHQTSDEVIHHAFATSGHVTTPDRWIVDSDTISTPVEPPTQVTDVVARPDGSLVAIFGADDRLHLTIRSSNGIWGKEFPVDDEKPYWQTSPALVSRPDGTVDIAYKTVDGKGWHRQLLANNSLTPPVQFAEELGSTEDESMAILPLLFFPETNTLAAVYRQMDGYLYLSTQTENGEWSEPVTVSDRTVVTNAIDSDQVGADAVGYNNTVYVSFIAEENRNIYLSAIDLSDEKVSREAPAIRRVVADIDGSWVRGNVLHSQLDLPVYGIVYDAGSLGGSGFNKYLALPLEK